MSSFTFWCVHINTLRPRQNGRHFLDNIFKCIFLNENVWISIKISLNFVPMGPINNIPALVQITAWCRPGNKPLSEPMVGSLLTHICLTRPQWVRQSGSMKSNHEWFIAGKLSAQNMMEYIIDFHHCFLPKINIGIFRTPKLLMIKFFREPYKNAPTRFTVMTI